jgi:copper homeostasis protein
MPTPWIEVCVESPEGIAAAQRAGADRAELCAALLEGGLTPSAGALRLASAIPGIEVVALVRPRGGDFCYSTNELDAMRADIDAVKAAGLAGVAIGALRADGSVDADALAPLIAQARPLAVTFHRAFDLARDPWAALDALRALGVDRILTSGQRASAAEGAELLCALAAATAERGPAIVAAGGIRAPNVAALLARTGVREVHFSARRGEPSPMTFRNAHCRLGGAAVPGEYERFATDEAAILATVRAARGAG